MTPFPGGRFLTQIELGDFDRSVLIDLSSVAAVQKVRKGGIRITYCFVA
jgi:hypothetical protein